MCYFRCLALLAVAVVGEFSAAKTSAAEENGPDIEKSEESSEAADVTVKGMELERRNNYWRRVPDYLKGQMYTKRSASNTQQRYINELEFTVDKSGVVVIAALWTSMPPVPDGWFEGSPTPKDMIDQGWTPIDKVESYRLIWIVFRRVVEKGEQYKLRTNPRLAPVVFHRPPADIVMAKKPITANLIDLSHLDAVEPLQGVDTRSGSLALDIYEPGIGEKAAYAHILRELPRQALFLAAREELQLTTRDAMLREKPRSTKSSISLGTVLATKWGRYTETELRKNVRVVVAKREGESITTIFEDRFLCFPYNIVEDVTARAEKYSRGEFVEALKRVGYSGKRNEILQQGPVSAAATTQLAEFTFISQFAAARTLHRQIRDEGESPERLAALARAYANLSLLTDYYWWPTYKAYAARALLYAQRLFARYPTSLHSLWTRGYVRTLVGQHRIAATDLAAARRGAAEQSDGDARTPAWAVVVEALCRNRLGQVRAAEENEEMKPLAMLLQLVPVGFGAPENTTLETVDRVLEAYPGCYRAIAPIDVFNALGIRRAVVHRSRHIVAEHLYAQLLRLRDLPENVRAIAHECNQARLAKELTGGDEIKYRAKLIEALTGEDLSDPDSAELSWATLGHMIEELSFVHAWREVDFLRHALGVSADEEIEESLKVVAKHPYRAVIEMHHSERDRAGLTKDLFESLDERYLTISCYPMYRGIDLNRDRELGRLYNKPFTNYDAVYGNLTQICFAFLYEGEGVNPATGPSTSLMNVSPYMTATAIANVRFNWKTVQDHVDRWREEYPDNHALLIEIARHQLREERFAEAEKTVRQSLEDNRSFASYDLLAEIHARQNDADGWFRAVNEFVEHGEGYGLEHARAADALARYLMRANEFEKARPYADRAAASGAAWAMLSAAECYEGLNNFERSEQLVRAVSHRYAGSVSEWYQWCVRTNRGDQEAAAALVRNHAEMENAIGLQVGIYHMLNAEPAKALAAYRRSFEQTGGYYPAVFVTLLGIELEPDASSHERLVVNPWSIPKGTRHLHDVSMWIRGVLRGEGELAEQTKMLDSLVAKQQTASAQSEVLYFGARFLHIRGHDQVALPYLKACAKLPGYQNTKTLAVALLRKIEKMDQ